MAFNDNKDIILKGIGTATIKDKVNGNILFMDKGQQLSMEISTDSEDVFGGDSLYPIYTFATKTDSTIKLTNATFKASQLQFIASSKKVTSGVKAFRTIKINKTATTLGANLTSVKAISVLDPNGTPVSVVTETPQDTEIAVSETGAVTFGAGAVDGEYTVLFEYDAVGVKTMLLGDALPNTCEVFIAFYPDDLKSKKQLMNIYIPAARCDGSITLDTARDSAATPELTFKTIKEEGQENVMEITVSEYEQGE